MRRAALLLALALIASAGAGGGPPLPGRCSAESPPLPTIDVGGVTRRLNAAEALWRQRGPRAYRLNVLAVGGIGRVALEVEVRPGVAPRALRRPDGPGRPPTPGEVGGAERETVPGLFAQVRALLREQPRGRPCGTLAVTFDPHDGHLRSLRYDSAFAIDEEVALTVGPTLPLR